LHLRRFAEAFKDGIWPDLIRNAYKVYAVSDRRQAGFEVDVPVVDIEFLSDSISKQIDRPGGKIKLFRNVLRCFSVSDKVCDLHFLRGEAGIPDIQILQEWRHDSPDICFEHVDDGHLMLVQADALQLVDVRLYCAPNVLNDAAFDC
jgi:hypothetical protein